jgi:hypothetical protein
MLGYIGWRIGFVSHNRPPGLSRAPPDWLCLARSTLWRSHAARDALSQMLHPSQVWLCLAQSTRPAHVPGWNWVCLAPKVQHFIVVTKGTTRPKPGSPQRTQHGLRPQPNRISRTKRREAKETCSPAALGWGQKITPAGRGATCLLLPSFVFFRFLRLCQVWWRPPPPVTALYI